MFLTGLTDSENTSGDMAVPVVPHGALTPALPCDVRRCDTAGPAPNPGGDLMGRTMRGLMED